MSDDHRHHHHQDEDLGAALRGRLEEAIGEMRDLTATLAGQFVNGEIGAFTFDGATGITNVLDDQGSDALAYALYNNTDVPVTIQTSAVGVLVPKRFLMVAPLTINGHVQLVADATALGEKQASVLRWRFPSPQPFFACKLE